MNGSYNITYKPLEPGIHKLELYVNGITGVKGMINFIEVIPEVDPTKCVISGIGAQSYGPIQNSPVVFQLQSKDKSDNNINIGGADIIINIIDPNGQFLGNFYYFL
jgi:hypothetical protein